MSRGLRAALPMVRNRVLLLLAVGGLAAAAMLAFLTHAPNRLLSGRPIAFADVLHGPGLPVLVPALVLLAGPFLPRRAAADAAVAVAAALFIAGLFWLAGHEAASRAAVGSEFARTSLGAGFWAMLLASALAFAEAVRRGGLSPAGRIAAGFAAAVPVCALAATGRLSELSILREYANQGAAFPAAVVRHGVLVLGALAPTLAVGLPLGLRVQRRPAWRGPILSALNIIQTIPSIAMFGLLMAPLAGLAHAVPTLAALGISGVGPAPAIVALVLYALLPVVRNTAAGLDAVPGHVLDAARGMGMTARQILWRVEVPLALPVILAGLRITTVQLVGLAAVAALIGAGGLGAIMFHGLFANALDLVMLGAVPIVLLAVVADAGFRLITATASAAAGLRT